MFENILYMLNKSILPDVCERQYVSSILRVNKDVVRWDNAFNLTVIFLSVVNESFSNLL